MEDKANKLKKLAKIRIPVKVSGAKIKQNQKCMRISLTRKRHINLEVIKHLSRVPMAKKG